MTKNAAILLLEHVRWAFNRSQALQDKYPQDYAQATPSFLEFLDRSLDALIEEVGKCYPLDN